MQAIWAICVESTVLLQAARLFDGALPDPTKHAELDSAEHRALARLTAEESAVLLINQNHTLPLQLGALKNIAIIGPNSGCPAVQPPPPPPPLGQCTATKGIDCPNNDFKKFDNVTDEAACCALCLANKACIAAVLAVGALPGGLNQCLLKSSCDSPITYPDRIVIRTGRSSHDPKTGMNPWNCLAQRAMLGGKETTRDSPCLQLALFQQTHRKPRVFSYSNLEQQTDAFQDNHAHVVTLLEAAQVTHHRSRS